jgi:uncharacterized protein
MNAVETPKVSAITFRSIEAACDRIAPTWPLDQFIAVNPYWGWRSLPIAHAAGHLGSLAGTTLTMPRAWFREQWADGRFTEVDLLAAATQLGDPGLAEEARTVLKTSGTSEQTYARMALVTDLRNLGAPPRPGQSWSDHVTHEISQHCGSYFDEFQASWHQDKSANSAKGSKAVDVFSQWRLQQSMLHGVAWNNGRSWVRDQLAALPTEPTNAIETMLHDLNIPEAGQEAYLTALLGSINGWAAWCSYLRWQARLDGGAKGGAEGGDDTEIFGLLAIRLAWEWMLHRDSDALQVPATWEAWTASWLQADAHGASIAQDQRVDWVLQQAVEHSYQQTIVRALGSVDMRALDVAPSVQAVFCIDVRSEVFRRALEGSSPAIHTRGFAGFFGLPISYTPAASALTRPQLPGLLAPALNVTESQVPLAGGERTRWWGSKQSGDGARQYKKAPGATSSVAHGFGAEAMRNERSSALAAGARLSTFRSAPASVFSFVESMGLLYGPKLIKDSLPNTGGSPKWEHEGLSATSRFGLRPQLGLVTDDPAAAAAIANRVLRGMGLIDGFAALVLLCGHGSQSANNPQAAGLDCGACGGQTGEVNARVLADLLNAPAVRAHLVPLGIVIPQSTWFVPGLHNTTTDEVQLFDTELVPATQRQAIEELRVWLAEAGNRARAERAPSLGLEKIREHSELLKRTVLERANDWSQVRPEWGLAGNAVFVVAPRKRTRHMNLGGRSFLHDYDWQTDTDLSTLTLIMTAPMVVTNWINMQYNASTVDNRRYGSGNKVLHNVVGGRIGVFEGNGGDLRIGLAMQSLHDGEVLRHQPLRLSVFIEAPRQGIDSVIAEHEVVRDLVANSWIHLFRIETGTGDVEQWKAQGWTAWTA